jgi:alpha-1,3-rhamnosyl/mannosyltransferase
LLDKVFGTADRVLSVSRFNTDRLLEAFPGCVDKVAEVPNGAEDLFFEPTPPEDVAAARVQAGLWPDQPYLLSVANFQPRKNLARLVGAAGRLKEVASGELALVFVGNGSESERALLKEATERLGDRASVRFVGYREGPALRALYAGASALVFPSLCESFGIPVVEAMAQKCPVALADSTALPEIGGPAGWYYPPEDEDAIASVLRELLDLGDERARRVELGEARAMNYRWDAATARLMDVLGGGSR